MGQDKVADAPAEKKRILIVDDDVAILSILEESIKQEAISLRFQLQLVRPLKE